MLLFLPFTEQCVIHRWLSVDSGKSLLPPALVTKHRDFAIDAAADDSSLQRLDQCVGVSELRAALNSVRPRHALGEHVAIREPRSSRRMEVDPATCACTNPADPLPRLNLCLRGVVIQSRGNHDMTGLFAIAATASPYSPTFPESACALPLRCRRNSLQTIHNTNPPDALNCWRTRSASPDMSWTICDHIARSSCTPHRNPSDE
jgi:hypothetical protein